MGKLRGFQRKYLRGLAHSMKPVVFIGHKGLTENIIKEVDGALNAHEVIKIKFIEIKDKEKKQTISESIERKTGSEMVGMTGHTVILFRQNTEHDKRKIILPTQKT